MSNDGYDNEQDDREMTSRQERRDARRANLRKMVVTNRNVRILAALSARPKPRRPARHK